MSITAHRSHPVASDSEGSIAAYGDVPATAAVSIATDWLRTDVEMLSEDVRGLQNNTRAINLKARAHAKATRQSTADLLAELAEKRGMSWTDIAATTGVSISAVRKWRKGEQPTSKSRQALASIAAFLDMLEDKDVAEPAAWMEMPLPLPAGYSIRPIDLYCADSAEGVLDLAEPLDSAGIQAVLDRIAPSWREDRSDYEVVTDTDGQRSIKLRGE